MTNYICKTCGTQYPDTSTPPEHCPICEDERQYIGWDGQEWTTLTALQQDHKNEIRLEEPGLYGIATQPGFAIGQRALLVQTPEGNLLWDCVNLIDAETIEQVKALGGIQALAMSHPHLYSGMVEWAHAFNAPIYLHELNRKWVMRPDPLIQYWSGERQELLGGLTQIRCGGHFPGGTVLHWSGGAGGKGAILTGDIVNVVQDRRYVSFLYSYPNQIPLPISSIRKIVQSLEPFAFERIYSGWWGKVVSQNGKESVRRSAERYIAVLDGSKPVE
jgi:glyoxylase-like metal-dependent hydrolase (beta-lactamase superfamily II)